MKRDWLVKIRKQNKLTQVNLAKNLNISPSYYGDIETGRRTPSSLIALKIATFLEFPMEWFILPTYLHNVEKGLLKLAMQMDVPTEEIFLEMITRLEEKINNNKSD
ncbi:helix-turn-helix transcriptional regulator [Bacillus thuringiensis]|uniref:Transcriptional regulator n=2 Tax=Bacillus TaxID=1386 RepID=A0A9W3KJW8_BACTU|nr:helix-turn-helix transcriptional regulator [Bacillus thuringiensis]EKS8368971.1 helix-turn-helix transcriptional regulator [Bacillus cereus]AHA74587.1 transcriptional regulator [Bacillus thuringiensis YBT-1518]MBG9486675.1 transcriptional regulator [Bacillus thuringiensis]MBG9497560.1 transcriptional regulator [Bacillus thuringiensis]MBG9509522.1 transcriptional regulator [Bacillus thuringiensis]